MPETVRQKTIKYGGNTIGIGAGNGVAFFLLWWFETKHGIVFDDPVVAMAMGGGLLSILFMELGKLGRAIKYVFDRFFPPVGGGNE